VASLIVPCTTGSINYCYVGLATTVGRTDKEVLAQHRDEMIQET
jgi:hypothetical protein